MRIKGLLAAFLLGVGLCFVPALGHGEVVKRVYENEGLSMRLNLLQGRIDYLVAGIPSFISKLPEHVDTKGKIWVRVCDTRDVFINESGISLLDEFKKKLEVIYSFIELEATNMDTDIVAIFYSGEGIPLGYFYQGGYHLWGE